MRFGSRDRNRDEHFTEFATVAAPRLFRSALLMCGDWHLAEDLVQTTLGKLYVAWSKVEHADEPEAYARGALTKTFLSHKRLKRSSELPSADPMPGSAVAYADAAHDDGTRLELFRALRTLPPLDRAIVVLRYWEDRSVSETAEQVGMSEGAVRTRATRALAKLRAELTSPAADRSGSPSAVQQPQSWTPTSRPDHDQREPMTAHGEAATP